MKMLIFANAFTSISGGDRIFAEVGRRLQKDIGITVVTNEKGKAFCLEHGIPSGSVLEWKASSSEKYGFYFANLYKTASSVMRALFMKGRGVDLVYSASDFWPDLFSALLYKLRFPKTRLIAGCFQVANFPFSRSGIPYRKARGVAFYLTQRLSIFLIKLSADAVFTTSPADKKVFFNSRGLSPETVLAVRGGVDFKAIDAVCGGGAVYDAVFMGRLHPQKCVDELLDIWSKVLDNNPQAKLAIIGSGPLETQLKKKVSSLGMESAVSFLGTVVGDAKVRLLKGSRVFISASRYDSGNIALDEALACGLPGVIYDNFRLHYETGVIKVPAGEIDSFVSAVSKLLEDPQIYSRLSGQARAFARQIDWDKKAEEVLGFIKERFPQRP